MKMLHIAAFEGNIGDNASHMGFLNILDSVLVDYEIDRLEIRKAYKNYIGDDKFNFDYSFVSLANQYDVVVFGGGGFLDYWVQGSSNGTTIDIESHVLKQIKTPILITSVGSNPHKEVPIENYSKFSEFLKFVQENSNVTIALRNDGSINSIVKDFGENYINGIYNILDHGFFYDAYDQNSHLVYGEKYVALNITHDQLLMGKKTSLNREEYIKELEMLIRGLSTRGFKTVFVPHIHQDVVAISEVIDNIPSNLVRNSTFVAPCIQGDNGANYIFNIYKNASFVIASRYHANVCSMKFGVPTIGLSPLPRIEFIHEQLSNLGVDTSFSIAKGFANKILSTIGQSDRFGMNSEKLEKLKQETIQFYRKYFSKIKCPQSKH